MEAQKEGVYDPEARDEYISMNVFWVPPETRWDYLQRNAKQPTTDKIIDNAIEEIRRNNRSLKGVLPLILS